MLINRFLDWYERHLTESLALSAFILYLQIPHTISAAECFFAEGSVGLYGLHPITFLAVWYRFIGNNTIDRRNSSYNCESKAIFQIKNVICLSNELYMW